MTGRDWKPGDVAMVKSRCCGEYVGTWDGVLWRGGARAHLPGDVIEARPVVVIDPEDREQVERFTDTLQGFGINTTGWDLIRAALREFANPTPPKPEEPTGLGAVVETVLGPVVRNDTSPAAPRAWVDHNGVWRKWSEINAVRVLSEGVTP